MTTTKKTTAIDVTTICMIGVMALARLLPHWPNVTPVMAVAVMGGFAFASRSTSIAVSLGAMLVSDVAMAAVLGWNVGFHDTQLVVYGSIVLGTLIGRAFRNDKPVMMIFGAGTLASVLFFLTTNFAVWAGGTMYPHTASGLLECYAAGLAFYQNSGNFFLNGLISTWAFSGLMVGALSLIRKAVPAVQR